ncbi:OmpA family protein [Flavobacteriaceae bacterium AU392]|nr:OmpA family protein [Flavobacteriaceae bacterium]RKM84740.1 OmpA family protein [Flavobacteriaceae bacterium AU392]
MKNLSKLLLILFITMSFSNLNAQDKNNPWAIGIGTNAVDFFPTGNDSPFSEGLFDDFFGFDNYNFVSSVTTVSVSRYISDGFSFGIMGSYNLIENFGELPVDDLTYFGLDGTFFFNFSEIINLGILEPYIGLGSGFTWVDDIGSGTLNGTLGLNFRLSDKVGFNVQTSYKNSYDASRLADHFQHSVGLNFKFGGKDTDGDGIYDKNDACPDVPGLAEFNGCPDSDGDGIQDSKDTCPNEAGLAEFNGCPDSDGDGIADNKDNCPNVAGLKSLNGCPDADGDGVTDASDNCPNEAGPSANNGCPWPDSDGDGVLDKDDQCPNEVGTVANNGCPEVVVPTEEVQKQLTEYARTINFNSSRSTFKDDAFPTLQAITAILKEYPKANFRIEGHTDSTGSETGNQKLSEARAKAVLDYLVTNGISSNRLTSQGYGQGSPIETNKTRAGRAANRRVEVKLVN